MKQDSGIELFQLIHSLSKSEKRSINLRLKNSSQSGNSNLHSLFTYLSASKEYRYEKLKQNYANSNLIKHYPSTKFKLTEIILNELVESQSGKLASDKNEQYLRHINFLIDRNLFQAAWRLICRVKKRAYELQDYEILGQVLYFEKLVYPHTFKKSPTKVVAGIIAEEKIVHKNQSIHQNLFSLLHLLITQGMEQFRIPELNLLHEYEIKVSKQVEEYKNTKLHNHAQFFLNASIAIVKQFSGHHAEAGLQFSKAFLLAGKHPLILQRNPLVFSRLYYFSIVNELLAGNQDNAGRLFQNMQQIPLNSDLSRWVYHEMHVLSKAYINLFGQKYEKLESIRIHYLKEGNINHSIYYKRHFAFIMMLKYLKLKQYGNGLFWLNELKQSSKSDFAADIHKLLRIFELIFHFELGNLGNINYLLRSTQRHLAKTKSIYPYERILHRFATDIIRTIGNKQFYYHIDVAKSDLDKLIKQYPNQPFGIEHILLWINQSLQSIPAGFSKLTTR